MWAGPIADRVLAADALQAIVRHLSGPSRGALLWLTFGRCGRQAGTGLGWVTRVLCSQAREDAAAMRQRAAEAELQLAPAHAELQRLSAVADRCGPIGCTGG